MQALERATIAAKTEKQTEEPPAPRVRLRFVTAAQTGEQPTGSFPTPPPPPSESDVVRVTSPAAEPELEDGRSQSSAASEEEMLVLDAESEDAQAAGDPMDEGLDLAVGSPTAELPTSAPESAKRSRRKKGKRREVESAQAEDK